MSLSYALPLRFCGLGMALACAAETGHFIHADPLVGGLTVAPIAGAGNGEGDHRASASHLFGNRSYQ